LTEPSGESQATEAIFAGADTHSTSPNGYGATTTPSVLANPAIVLGAALVGGLLLAGLIRRFRG
jgi:hypothetical protein